MQSSYCIVLEVQPKAKVLWVDCYILSLSLSVCVCVCVSSRYVCIAMEALDQLLMACHCQSINLFVESFLKMVAKLLESEKPDLQILGTNSVGLSLLKGAPPVSHMDRRAKLGKLHISALKKKSHNP